MDCTHKSRYDKAKENDFPSPDLPLSVGSSTALPVTRPNISNSEKIILTTESELVEPHDTVALLSNIPCAGSGRQEKRQATDAGSQRPGDNSYASSFLPLLTGSNTDIASSINAVRDGDGNLMYGEIIHGNEERGSGRFKRHRLDTGTLPNESNDSKGGQQYFHCTDAHDRDSYEGEFEGGVFQGQGIYRSAEGDIYRGEFSRGKFSDQGGVLTYASGIVYSGQFKNQVMHGLGICTWPSGNFYHGYWKEGVRDGVGREVYASNGITYEGEWQNDQRNGYGTSVSQAGNIYQGNWKNDQRDGYGEEISIDTDPNNRYTYQGEWKNNEREGPGILRFADGQIYEGMFDNGEYIGSTSETEINDQHGTEANLENSSTTIS